MYGFSTRWLTSLTIDPDITGVCSIDIMDILAAEDIESRPVWKPMHLQPLFRGFDYYPHTEEESISDRLFELGLCLPSGSSLSEDEQSRVLNVIKTILA